MATPVYTDFRRQLAEAEATAALLMKRVRDAVAYLTREHRYSLTVLASVTTLHKNSVMRLKDSSWVPRPETLELLERLVDRAEAKRRGETFKDEHIRRGRPPAPVSKPSAKKAPPKAKHKQRQRR
jgi:hypothetical protein